MTKIDGSANIQKSLLAVCKTVFSTVKNGHLHYFFSRILFLLLFFCYWLPFVIHSWSTAGDHHGDWMILDFGW
jgi:hypothetical protein